MIHHDNTNDDDSSDEDLPLPNTDRSQYMGGFGFSEEHPIDPGSGGWPCYTGPRYTPRQRAKLRKKRMAQRTSTTPMLEPIDTTDMPEDGRDFVRWIYDMTKVLACKVGHVNQEDLDYLTID